MENKITKAAQVNDEARKKTMKLKKRNLAVTTNKWPKERLGSSYIEKQQINITSKEDSGSSDQNSDRRQKVIYDNIENLKKLKPIDRQNKSDRNLTVPTDTHPYSHQTTETDLVDK